MSAVEKDVATQIESSDKELSLRDQLMAARDEIETRENEPEPQEEPKEVKTRDERGRFAPVSEPEPEPEPAPVAAEKVVDAPVAAPPSWSYAAKAKWAELPPEIRTEISKREADVTRGFTKMDEERSFAKEMQKAVAPYEAMIRSEGGNVPAAVQSLLNTAYILRTGDPASKASAIAQVCRQYGIDLSQAQSTNVDPQTAAVNQRIAQLEAQLARQQQASMQAQTQQVESTIQAFAADPKHPHFEAVKVAMGALMTSGQAASMEEAYDMAVWARPDLRSQLLQQQTVQQQQERRQKTEKARVKGASVRGGTGGIVAPPPENRSLREELEAAFAESNGRI